MGFMIGKEVDGGFETSWLVKKLFPATSGNTINGLGEKEDRPATPIFHRMHKHPFRPINILFLIKGTWDLAVLASVRRSGILKSEQYKDLAKPLPALTNEQPAEHNTQWLKAHAMSLEDCDVIGVADNHPNLYFDREFNEMERIPKYVVVVGLHQNYDMLSASLIDQKWWKKLPWKSKYKITSDTVMNIYERTHKVADQLARDIRARGHHAIAYGGAMGSAVNILRSAIEAGHGDLGKHGSILNDKYGANLRFAVIATDLPLVADGPRSVGGDEFCYSCKVCTNICPPDAISDRKQLVRGVKKWYVDFDKCMPFFIDTKGCGMCITACPWSRPGVAGKLTLKMMKKINRKKAEKAKALETTIAETPTALPVANDQSVEANPTVTFLEATGNSFPVQLKSGQSLMEGAVKAGIQGIEAECGGAASCATCHVILDAQGIELAGRPEGIEDDMLEMTATERTPTSRLSCQVVVTPNMDGMVVTLPESQ